MMTKLSDPIPSIPMLTDSYFETDLESGGHLGSGLEANYGVNSAFPQTERLLPNRENGFIPPHQTPTLTQDGNAPSIPVGELTNSVEHSNGLANDPPLDLTEPISHPHTEASATESGFLPVLRNPNFLTLWSGQVFSQLADKVYLVLMIALIDSLFQSQDQSISGWVSSIMIAFTVPAVLFGSIAGAFVDRWPKRLVLVVTNLLRGLLVLGLPFFLWVSGHSVVVGTIPLNFMVLLLVTLLVSTLTQFFAPAEQSAIPLLVAPQHLLSANSLYATTMMASVIVGLAIGEPTLAIADTLFSQMGINSGKEIVVGGGYLVAGLLLLLLKISEKETIVLERSTHIFEDLWEGIRYLGETRRLRAALVQLIGLYSIFAAIAVLSVRMAEIIPEIKSSQFGFLLAAGGVGMASSAAIIGHGGQTASHSRLSLYGSIGLAVALAGLGLFGQHLLPALILLATIGAFSALIAIPLQTLIQQETALEMRGKVFGLQNNLVNIALSLPLALAGVSETFLGFRTVFLGLAALSAIGSLLSWQISLPTSQKS